MDIDFSPSARAVAAGFSPGERVALERHLRRLAETLGEGQQRSAVFDMDLHLVSCTFERTTHRLSVLRLRRLPLGHPAST